MIDLHTFLAATDTDGLVVLKDGDIAYEYCGCTNTESSKHIMMSMTKSITGRKLFDFCSSVLVHCWSVFGDGHCWYTALQSSAESLLNKGC